MVSTALDRSDRLLTGTPIHPFDWVNNPLFYDPKPAPGTEYHQRLLAQAKVAYVAAHISGRGLSPVFIPGSMANGTLAYKLAEDYADKIRANTKARFGEAFLTTQRLDKHVARGEQMDRVIRPCRIQNHAATDAAERLRPGMAAIGPVDFEGPLRVARSNPALSRGASFQEWTFESWWGPRVIDSAAMMLTGDHAFSRYANVEEVLGDVIQCGFLDQYRDHVGPGSTFDITDNKGVPVTLADRAWETAKHIFDVVERGFRVDISVAALVARFQIDDWLRDPANSPLDMDKVHPALKNRSADELAQMDRLKSVMLPYIAQKCASWVPYNEDPDLKRYFEGKIIPAAKELTVDDIKAAREALFSHQPKGGYVYENADVPSPVSAALGRSFAANAREPKRRGTDGSYFDTPARLFDDYLFDKLSIWEQAALTFSMGCMESHRLPESAPRSFFFACHPKGGAPVKEWAEKKRGIDWPKEAQAYGDHVNDNDSFPRSVIAVNIKNDTKARADIERIVKGASGWGVANVVSRLDLNDLNEVVEKNREFVAAEGAQGLSSRAMTALLTEMLDRNHEGLILRKDWQYNAQDVHLAVRAVLHATGLAERPYEGGRYRMEIFVYDPDEENSDFRLKKQNLHDLVTTLGKTVERWLDQTPHIPDRETYLACARLLEIVDKLADPGQRNYEIIKDSLTGKVKKSDKEIISWSQVDRDFYGFWFDNPAARRDLSATPPGSDDKTLRDRLREKLLTVGVLEFTEEDLDGLHEDYAAAWSVAHGRDALERRHDRPSQGTHLGQKGPV